MATSLSDILKDLKAKNYAPVYFLHGEEPFFMDQIANYIEQNVLSTNQKAFNQVVCYGNEVEFSAILNNCRQLPVMADRRVIIVREAQNIRTKEFEGLLPYLSKPSPKTILVFVHKHKNIDGRSMLAKELKKNGAIVFKSDKVRDYKLQEWIKIRYTDLGYNIEHKAAALLAEYLGNDLTKIEGEVKKLMDSVEEGSKITPELVQQKIGVSKDYNVFELQNAIIRANKNKAFKIIKHFAKNPKSHPVIPIIALLFSFFSKVIIAQHYLGLSDRELMTKLGMRNAYFVKDYRAVAQRISKNKLYDIFEQLKIADMRSKGIGGRTFSAEEILLDLGFAIF